MLVATTVFVISASYSQIIELFPTGGGGYLVASHLLGFMNEVSAEEVRAKKDEGYHPGDLIGPG